MRRAISQFVDPSDAGLGGPATLPAGLLPPRYRRADEDFRAILPDGVASLDLLERDDRA